LLASTATTASDATPTHRQRNACLEAVPNPLSKARDTHEKATW